MGTGLSAAAANALEARGLVAVAAYVPVNVLVRDVPASVGSGDGRIGHQLTFSRAGTTYEDDTFTDNEIRRYIC